MPYISFITAHANRLEHLSLTLPHNLKIAEPYDCEFVICHLGDKSGAAEWQRKNFPQTICLEAIGERFHYARACNCAHRHATGIIQCTLDADNILTDQYMKDLVEAFWEGEDAIYHEHNALVPNNECAGRIALRRETFRRIGGYEERFTDWGGVDTELVNRCCDRIGLVNKRRMKGSWCIHHGDDLRQKDDVGTAKCRALFKECVERKMTVANEGREWGCLGVPNG